MAIVYLDSHDDPRLAAYRDLPSRTSPNQTTSREAPGFVVEGRFLVERMLASNVTTESIVIDTARLASLPAGTEQRTTIYVLPSRTIDRLVGFKFHRGMLACGKRPAFLEIDQLVCAENVSRLTVVCSQISDPANLGGVLRNAAAFGVNAILLGPGCADPFSRRVVRASMGAMFRLPLAVSKDLTCDVRRLSETLDITLVAAVLDADAEPLPQMEVSGRIGLILGNEGFGLPNELIELCQRKAIIPIQANVDSLNVAVASGVLLYHFSTCNGAGS